ncbi:MAG TPA: GGDEF domain-containing protein [Deltaproteobacteria bacterium]|nr:GGDEF domain-containing protein [Deltaproteobacteria bacterium]
MATKVKDNNHCEDLLNLGPEIEKCQAKGFSFLIFPRRIEQIFLADTLESRRKRFFILGIIAILIYNLFLFTDREMLPDIYLTAWKIRLVIFTPLMIICLLLMRLPIFARFIDFITDFLVLIASASILVILELSHHPNVVHYHTGIILIVMFGNIVVRLRFWHAFGVSWLTFLLYVLAVSSIEQMPPPVMINSSVVLLSAIIISLIANYQMENDRRVDYLRELLKEIEAIRLKKTKAQLEQLSSSDDLTGLANRRHFDICLAEEWKMAVNYRSSLSLLFLDVDDFKPYNDHYGHQAGDDCLRKIAAVLRQAIRRPQDICARYGGEEFVVLLPNTLQENATQLAENIRKGVEREKIPHNHSRAASYVTVSIGIASLIPRPGLNQNILVELADKVLYKAKEMGRNRVQVFDHTE